MPSVNISISPEARTALNKMRDEYGMRDRASVVMFIAKAYEDGRLIVLDKVTKECLVSAAEERILKLAKKTAREEVLYQLWNEGYRTDPYER